MTPRAAGGGTLWYFVPPVIGAMLPLLTLPIITRVLAPAEYGAWVLAYVYALFVTSIGNFGMTVAYERNFFEYTEPRMNAALLWGTMALVTTMLAILLSLTWLARDAVAAKVLRLDGYGMLVGWTTTAAAVASLKAYFLLYLRNVKESRLYALFTIDESVLGALLTIGFVAGLRTGPVGLAWGPLLASVVVLAALLRHMGRRVPPALDARPVRASVRLSVPLLPRILLGVVGTQFDKWVVGVLGSASGVAIYSIGQRLAHMVFVVATALENAFQPRTYALMFERGAEGAAEIGRLLTPYAYITVGCALGISVFADEAIALLADDSYAGGAAITNILVLHYALMFFGKQPQLAFAKRTDLTSILSLASLALTVPIVGAAAYWYGAHGAAAGTLLAGALGTWLFIAVGQRCYRIRYESAKLLVLFGWLFVASASMILIREADVAAGIRWTAKAVILGSYAWFGWRAGWIPTRWLRVNAARQ